MKLSRLTQNSFSHIPVSDPFSIFQHCRTIFPPIVYRYLNCWSEFRITVIMRHSLFSSVVIGSLAWYSAAFTTRIPLQRTHARTTPIATPTPIAAPTLSGEETARQQNLNHCVIFWPADLKTTMLGCKDVCGTKLANDPAAPDIQASQSCISFNQPWQRADGGMY